MNAQIELIPGTNRDKTLSQWFTPPELAQRVVEWALHGYRATLAANPRQPEAGLRPMRVLEPSAGNGALVRPLVAAGASVLAIEQDERYCHDLLKLGCMPLCPCDFLDFEIPDPIDLCVMNPPYEDGKDVAFILHALKFAPRVVGIFTDRILFGVERKEGLWAQVRPTRIAFQSRRPFKGAQTDYVVAELVSREGRYADELHAVGVTMEWW